MSDTDRMYALLKNAGRLGVHTLDLRHEQISGNPSQRATDIEKKYGVRIDREREYRDGRNGSRYKLAASPIPGSSRGNTGAQGGESPSSPREAAPASQLFEEPEKPKVPTAYDPYSEAA